MSGGTGIEFMVEIPQQYSDTPTNLILHASRSDCIMSVANEVKRENEFLFCSYFKLYMDSEGKRLNEYHLFKKDLALYILMCYDPTTRV